MLATVVSTVATAYFQLRELDLELEISKQTLVTRQESLRISGCVQPMEWLQRWSSVRPNSWSILARATIPDL